MLFRDRTEAGRRLSEKLRHLRGQDVVVLALPRGGVPVGFEVASALGAPLDVIVVRKLGMPSQPELGMGAIGEDGVRIVDEELIHRYRVSEQNWSEVEERERAELARRASAFRRGRPRQSLRGRTALVIDDGVAMGSTARAACDVARAQGADRVVLAVPVAPPGWKDRLRGAADELVCLATPTPFFSIGQFYDDFDQVSDAEVTELLQRAASPAPASDPPASDNEVEVGADGLRLPGHLTVPEHAVGAVLFAHGSGSSRGSPRNRFVAAELNRARLATLLFDLLTPDEERDRAHVFDVELLGRRLHGATRWFRAQSALRTLPLAYFGASTGAAAALWAAAEPDAGIAAVVSRGGRPDLAGSRLRAVTAPTLLLVGEQDETVLALNRAAQAHLGGDSRLVVIPGATHLFEEPGALQAVAQFASEWCVFHLAGIGQRV